ncbi:MAG: thioesterase [Lachnospiraceae bacterium]
MYSIEGRVRYSEIDKTGKLSLPAVLDYFQDCSTFHSEDIGVGITYLEKLHCAWLMSAWQIVVTRYPRMGERIKIVTFPYEFKNFLGLRNFYMEDEAGQQIACANSIWTYMDMEAGRPVRLPQEMQDAYVLSDRLPMEYAPRKIPILKEGVRQEPLVIKRHHLDTNHHVNNGQYLRIAMDYIGADAVVKQMRAEYKKSAVLGDIMIPSLIQEKDIVTIILSQDNGDIYAVIELTMA